MRRRTTRYLRLSRWLIPALASTVMLRGLLARSEQPTAAKQTGMSASTPQKETSTQGVLAEAIRPQSKTTQTSSQTSDLAAVKAIQAAYRANFARLMPLAVSYRAANFQEIGLVEHERYELWQQELLSNAKVQDLSIDSPGAVSSTAAAVLNTAAAVGLVRHAPERVAELKRQLDPDFVARRLKTANAQNRFYFWTDGQAYHARWPTLGPRGQTALLEAGPISAGNLLESYPAVCVESYSRANHPPLRCWFGVGSLGPGGQVTDDTLSTFLSFFVVPPLGFTDRARAPEYFWSDLDLFMLDDPAQYRIVGRAPLHGRSTILVEKLPRSQDDLLSSLLSNLLVGNASPEWRERTRAWIDPSQGFLPLRLEKAYVNSANHKVEPPHCVVEVTEVQTIAGSFYPTRGKRQEFVEDARWTLRRAQDQLAGKKLADEAPPPRLPSWSQTWEVSQVAPRHPLEPQALALEFPAGTLYLNKVTQDWYRAPSQAPLPKSGGPTKPGTVAPPLAIARWTDGRSRNLADLRGKVVVLDFWGMWCGGCVRDIPEMKSLQKAYHDRDVVFAAIHTAGADLDKLHAFQREKGWDALIGVDDGDEMAGTTATTYGVQCFPTLIVIGRDGRVAFNSDVSQQPERIERTAKALSIHWPLNEKTPKEEAARASAQIFQHLMREAIDRALAQ